MSVPQIVLDLAATVNGGTPLAWHEYDDHWTIVMQDGRKMHFAKNAGVDKPRHEETVQDYKEPAVDTHPPRRHAPRRDK